MSDGNDEPQLERSVARQLPDGRVRKWPSREDYANWYGSLGHLEGGQDFASAVDLPGSVFLDWVRRGQTACQFASVLSTKYERAGWQSVVVPSRCQPTILVDHVDSLLAAAQDHAEIVQLVFPYVVTPESLVELIHDLCVGPNWYWEEIDGDDEAVLVGLRWLLPTGRHVSWNVGFGPFDFLPFTRRGPFTAVLVRVSPIKRTSNSPDVYGRTPVHLADMDDLLPSDKVRTALNEKTRAAKTDYLAGEMIDAARARVTFRIPGHLRSRLPDAGASGGE